jgi:hypothetical protein
MKKILKNILLQLDENKYSHLDEAWEVNQLIDKIKEFLKNRRYSFNYSYSPLVIILVNLSFSFGVNSDELCSNCSFQVHFP